MASVCDRSDFSPGGGEYEENPTITLYTNEDGDGIWSE